MQKTRNARRGALIASLLFISSICASAQNLTTSPLTTSFTITQGSTGALCTKFDVGSSTSTSLNYTASVSSSPQWLSLTSDFPASGNTPGSVRVCTNSTASTLAQGQYSGSLILSSTNAANAPLTISIPLTVQSACTVTVNSGAGYTSGPGSGAVTITTQPGCTWNASTGSSFLTLQNTTGSGSGTANYTLTSNTGSASRSGTITVTSGGSMGIYTVMQAAPNTAEGVYSSDINPYYGSGTPVTFVAKYTDTLGWAALGKVYLLINNPGFAANSCYIEYDTQTRAYRLRNDNDTAWLSTTSGSVAPLTNSQCTLDQFNSTATGSGNDLLVSYRISAFSANFNLIRHLYLTAYNTAGNVTGNTLVLGSWYPQATTGTLVNWYRIYDPYTHSHHYTMDKNEYDTLGTRGYTLEGSVGQVYNAPATFNGQAAKANHRLLITLNGTHFWTLDRNEFLFIVQNQGAFQSEATNGAMFQNAGAGLIPFYRMVYTGPYTGPLHLWTTDLNEYTSLNGAGWSGEGPSGYLLPNSVGGASATVTSSARRGRTNSPRVVAALHGATQISGGVTPGQVLSLRGYDLTESAALEDTSVLVNSTPAQVIYTSPNEVRVIVPDFTGDQAFVQLESRGSRSNLIQVSRAHSNPGLFTRNPLGFGQVEAKNADGSDNSAEQAAARGSVVTLFATGMPAEKGLIRSYIGGHRAQVVDARVSATRAGTVELQVRIPAEVTPAESVPVTVMFDEAQSQSSARIAVQ